VWHVHREKRIREVAPSVSVPLPNSSNKLRESETLMLRACKLSTRPLSPQIPRPPFLSLSRVEDGGGWPEKRLAASSPRLDALSSSASSQFASCYALALGPGCGREGGGAQGPASKERSQGTGDCGGGAGGEQHHYGEACAGPRPPGSSPRVCWWCGEC
jgi:hypothetical protein